MRNTQRLYFSLRKVNRLPQHTLKQSNKVTSVDEAYNAIKEESKAVLANSRQKVFGVDAQLRAEYEEIERVRGDYEQACKTAEEQGTMPPSNKGVELRTTDELYAELETQQANLAMNLNTNPGVVEQYEKRKKEVRHWLFYCHLSPL